MGKTCYLVLKVVGGESDSFTFVEHTRKAGERCQIVVTVVVLFLNVTVELPLSYTSATKM